MFARGFWGQAFGRDWGGLLVGFGRDARGVSARDARGVWTGCTRVFLGDLGGVGFGLISGEFAGAVGRGFCTGCSWVSERVARGASGRDARGVWTGCTRSFGAGCSWVSGDLLVSFGWVFSRAFLDL